MFQNHMRQLLALTAMEAPPRFETEWVRDESPGSGALRPFPVDSIYDHLFPGNTDQESSNGKQLPGYGKSLGFGLIP